MKSVASVIILITLLLSNIVLSEVEVKILDTGPGLSVVARFDDGSIMVYDTGHYQKSNSIASKIIDFVGDRATIDLLIISHTDADHIGSTVDLLASIQVDKVIRTGFPSNTGTWRKHDKAIREAAESGLTHDINLASVNLKHGSQFYFGDATVTILSGFHKSPQEWGLHGSEYKNGNSIVAKLDYRGQSILLTGDSVGRDEDERDELPAIATERYLIDNHRLRPINASILIAPHHGGNDASSVEFIETVNPAYVVFSAGHKHSHPRDITVKRYLNSGIKESCILRTDRGDDEGKKEWPIGRIAGMKDSALDDEISIFLGRGIEPIVGYTDTPPVKCYSKGFDSSNVNTTNLVKKSRSGICHDSTSPWFERTKVFVEFNTIELCVDSGGREL